MSESDVISERQFKKTMHNLLCTMYSAKDNDARERALYDEVNFSQINKRFEVGAFD